MLKKCFYCERARCCQIFLLDRQRVSHVLNSIDRFFVPDHWRKFVVVRIKFLFLLFKGMVCRCPKLFQFVPQIFPALLKPILIICNEGWVTLKKGNLQKFPESFTGLKLHVSNSFDCFCEISVDKTSSVQNWLLENLQSWNWFVPMMLEVK